MSGADIPAIRRRLAATVTSATGLRCDAYPPNGSPNCPFAYIDLAEQPVEYGLFAGSAPFHLFAQVVVLGAPAQNGMGQGQEVLDQHLASDGSGSIYAALNADPTAGGLAMAVLLTQQPVQFYGILEYAGVPYAAMRLAVLVKTI